MTGAEVIALITGLPAVISAFTALVIALKSSANTAVTANVLDQHMRSGHE
jgi:hypothetical protein